MEQNLTGNDEREQFPFGPVTTGLFLLIISLIPLALVFRLFQIQVSGDVGTFFINNDRPTTDFQSYLFLIIPVTALAIWSFLRVPTILIHVNKMEPLDIKYPNLANQIIEWGSSVKLKNPIILLRIPIDKPNILAFGAWRHQYIAIADGAIELWERPDELRAVILHEYGHLASGDTWKARIALEYTEWLFVFLFLAVAMNVIPALFLRSDLNYGGFWGTVVYSLTEFVTGLLFIFSVRHLFRMREYGADYFATTLMGENKSIKDALFRHVSPAQTSRYHKLAFMSEGVQNRFTSLLKFHPSTISRLSLLDRPGLLIEDIMGIAGIAGMATGIVTTWYWDSYTLAILIAGLLLVGVPTLLFIIPEPRMGEKTDQLKLFGYFLRSSLSFATGASVAWILQIFPNSLLKLNVNDNGSHWVSSGEFRFDLAFSLDILLIIILIIPLLLSILAYFSWILSKLNISDLANKNRNLASIIWVWVAQLPLLIVFSWTIGRWWNGFLIQFNPLILLLVIGWAILIIIAYHMFNARSNASETK